MAKYKEWSKAVLEREVSWSIHEKMGEEMRGKTDAEKSLVCLTADVPENAIARDDGWRGFHIEGVLDFALIVILSKISSILSRAGYAIVEDEQTREMEA